MQELIDVQFEDQSFDDQDLFEADWRNTRFVRCRFQGADLRESHTDRCVFDSCDFTAARLNLSEHAGSAFVNCSFRMTKLFRARFVECKMTGSLFEQADLSSVVVAGGDWSYVNLRMQDLSGRKFRSLRLVNADLYGCDLRKTDLRDADLSHATLGQVQAARRRPSGREPGRYRPDLVRPARRSHRPGPGDCRGQRVRRDRRSVLTARCDRAGCALGQGTEPGALNRELRLEASCGA